MNLDIGTVVVNVPTPFAMSIGPSNDNAPVGSTAYRFSAAKSDGKLVKFTLIRLPSALRRMVAVPVAPVIPTGFKVTRVSLPTGYSTIVYVPSGFWTVCVLVTVVVC